MLNTSIIIAGFGGQGILFTGKVLAYAGMVEGINVSHLPSYGPEMRGGTANCTVCLCDDPVPSPLVTRPDMIVVMNQPSYDKFKNSVKIGGKVFIDNSLISDYAETTDGIDTFAIPATELAREKGLNGLANMIMLGKILKETDLFSIEEIEAGLKKAVPEKKAHLIPSKIEAVKLGMSL